MGRVAQPVQRLARGWTVRGSKPGGGKIFRTCPDRPQGPPSLLYNGYRFFPGGKERPGRDADPSPLLVPLVMKEQSYTSTPPLGRTAFTESQCLYKGALYLFCPSNKGAGIAQVAQRLDTGWTVREMNPGEDEIFRTRPDRPWGPSSLQYNGYRIFPGGKAAEMWR